MNSLILKIRQKPFHVFTLTTSRHDACRGFSLVEVVVALGIVSFAILPVFALIPAGLATFHNSSEIYFSSQARQQILNSLQQSDMKTLLNGNASYSETDYFDGEGTFLDSTSPAPLRVYQVDVTVSTQTPANQPFTLPDAIAPSTADNLINAVLVTTKFSRYKGKVDTSAGGSTYLMGTDYLYYNLH